MYILALDDDLVQALRKHAQHVGRGYMTTTSPQGQYIPTSRIPGVTFVD